MKRALPVTVICLAAALAAAQAPAPAPAAPPAASAVGAKVWIGHEAEIEEFLKTAPIQRESDIPVGVTHPRRAFFEPGGLVTSAALKNLPMAVKNGFWEAHQSEIAAYEMDRLLDLEMVPPTVERRVQGDKVSLQFWVEGCRPLTKVDQKACPKPVEWAKQVLRARVFDNLIANIDRNAGNILVDGEWNMILIDHSRAFASDKMPFEKEMTRVDRAFFERVKALDEPSLVEHIRPWVMSDSQVRGILKRRDKIVADLERLARERGEGAVFPF